MPRSKPATSPPLSTAPIASGLRSTPERIAESISKSLLKREYSVGQRLIEADLTERLGVSRSTVREALKILASQGIVDIIPHRGAVVRGLTRLDAECLLEVLEVLTGLAARLAAQNISQHDNKSRFVMASKHLVVPNEHNQLERVLDERAWFYQVMFDIADNEELNRAVPTWRAHVFRNQFFRVLTRADVNAMVKEYRNISQAILAGDGAKAELYARRHFQKTRERALPHLR